MITISKNAQKYLVSLLSHEPIGTHIRVFILHPGTKNAECGLAFLQKDEIDNNTDIKFKYDKFLIYINKEIISYLKKAEIDLVTDQLSSQLTLKAPYAKNNYAIKQSSLTEKIQNFLSLEINSKLEMHGGQVHLIKIDSNGTAKIRFSGGCNGCSMIGLTLKEIVEKKLLSTFSEIKRVDDATEHTRGEHSFY
ncbi:NfuA family Fe-S biogenesis protein [Buchnera aphidicola]|uniref:Fe/S biogenesis protein NfuA n=1 Tax=Buchnera aphidicola str. Ua (Uroleucon ambrosiae) TaxID=1005057 RepID=G2LQ24_BUCUM|nr:NfuA family Fe-S biogenesis protein [Buchnera aphidicola]AEO08311.1 iron-sulfur cluster scaffold protein [Buchnera aphidicola str. Ua (Uroleucon ambrosiae)]